MAISTVISQCEMWTDNMDPTPTPATGPVVYNFEPPKLSMVAEAKVPYGRKSDR